MQTNTISGAARVALLATGITLVAACANDAGQESHAATTQADTTTDLLSALADAAMAGAIGAPALAPVAAFITIFKDEYALGVDMSGGSSTPQTDPHVIQAINLLQSECGELDSQIHYLDARLQSDVDALALWDIWNLRADLEAISTVLAQNAAQAPILGRPAPPVVVSTLQTEVDVLEAKITVALEPMRANPPPDASDAVLALLENTYAIALRLRLQYAAAGFPMTADWALARQQSTPAQCHNAQTALGPDPACSKAFMPALQIEAAWATVTTELVDPYRPIKAGDFDGDGVADLVIHDPVTQNVIITKTVPGGHCTAPCYSAGNTPGGWVHIVGPQVSPSDWRLQAVADMNGDGVPDLIWGPAPQHLWYVAQPYLNMGDNTVELKHGDPSGTISIWYMTKAFTVGSWSAGYYTPASNDNPFTNGNAGATPIGAGDFNHDGFTDVLLGGVSLFDGQGPLSSGLMGTFQEGPYWGAFAALQGHSGFRPPRTPDGHMTEEMIFMDATSALKTYSEWYDTHWHIAGTGDFNGDGVADSAWYHTDDGQLQLWATKLPLTTMASSNPSNVTAGAEHLAVSNFSLSGNRGGEQVLTAADFNADGKPDFLWHSGGAVWVMTMNGTSEQSFVPLYITQ
jgi:hypothetical protein